MSKTILSILPTRRSSGPGFYEHPIYPANKMQYHTSVRPFERYHRKRTPLWVALLMFLSGVVGLICLMISIYE